MDFILRSCAVGGFAIFFTIRQKNKFLVLLIEEWINSTVLIRWIALDGYDD